MNVDVEQFYPELKDYKPQISGSFRTGLGTRVRWVNVSGVRFREPVAKQLFSYYEALGRQRISSDYSLGGKVFYFQMNPKSWKNDVLLFVTPHDSPDPLWAPRANYSYGGVTVYHTDGRPNLTRILVPDKKNLTAEELTVLRDELGCANQSLAGEVGQNTLIATRLTGEFDAVAQEMFQNSFARIVVSRQLRLSYAEYLNYVTGKGVALPLGVVGLFKTDEISYHKTPTISPVLTRK